MRRKKLWNKTVAAVLGLALIMGAPLVDLGNGRLLGGVPTMVQANHSTSQISLGLFSGKWQLTLSGTVTAQEIVAATNLQSGTSGAIKKTNIARVVCEENTVIDGSLAQMFQGFTALEEVDFKNATFTNTTGTSNMFDGCNSLKTINWGSFDMSGVTQAHYMFHSCSSLTSMDFSSFNMSSLTKANDMFNGCSSLQSVNFGTWDVSGVTSVANMFKECSSLTEVDLSNWDTSDVVYMSSMFNGCSNLTKIYASETWNTTKVSYGSGMFTGCTKLKGGANTTYNSSQVTSAYARFDSADTPGYLTYSGNLTKHDALAETFTDNGNEEYWTSPNDGPEYQLVNGLFVEVNDHDSEVVIPKILTTHYDEVPATPNSAGTKEHWDGKDGLTYLWSDDENTYVSALAEDLIINPTPVSSVDAVAATYTETGHTAYYTDGNGHYYELVGEEYVEHPLDYFTTPALLGTHHEATEVSPYEDGNDEYWESANEGMCYVSDGNGSYTEVPLTDVLHDRIGVKSVVPAKDPNYGTDGAGNVAYVIGYDYEIYVDDGTGHYVKTTLADVTISALQLYMQADPVNTQSAVDVLIYAELPAGATPEDYSVVFGDKEVQFDSDYYTIISSGDAEGTYLYKAKISAPAKNMATEYNYSIKNGETVMFTGTQTASIRKYALEVLGGHSSEAVKKSCRAMLAYGASAQILKGYDVENLANAGLEGDGLDYSGVELPDGFVFDKPGLNEVLANANAPVRYYGMGLAMEAETRVNLAFEIVSGSQDEAVAYMNENFTFGTKAVTAVKNSNVRYVVVSTDPIAIKNLLNSLSISYDGVDYEINVQQYFTSAKGANVKIQNMCKALRNYYDCVTAKNN